MTAEEPQPSDDSSKNDWDVLSQYRRSLPTALGLDPPAHNPSQRARAIWAAARAVVALEIGHPFVAVCCDSRAGLWANDDGNRTDDPPVVVLAAMLASKRTGEIVADPIGLSHAATVVEKAGATDVVAALQNQCALAERTLTTRWTIIERVAKGLLASPIGTLDRGELRTILDAS